MASYTYMSPEELVALLDNPLDRSRLAIIDCRDEDRSEGWIIDSIHMPSNTYSPEAYRTLAISLCQSQKKLAVFHCALSQVRGPKGASRFCTALQAVAALSNHSTSNHTTDAVEKTTAATTTLSLPEVKVLRGGWENFYAKYATSRRDLMCF